MKIDWPCYDAEKLCVMLTKFNEMLRYCNRLTLQNIKASSVDLV